MRDAWEQLRQALRALQRGWEEVQARWRDPVAERFQKEFIEPWEPLVHEMLQELEALDEELLEAERCLNQ
jgi:uncharacterized protein YukE